MSIRKRTQVKSYRKHLSAAIDKGCTFCAITPDSDQFVHETKSFKVIVNIFPYSHWDSQKVTDHLLIVPKKHTDTLNDLSAPEAVEYVDVIGSYESRGYNVYSRTPASGLKSIAHQHTHLIKGGKSQRALFYLRRPYIRITV